MDFELVVTIIWCILMYLMFGLLISNGLFSRYEGTDVDVAVTFAWPIVLVIGVIVTIINILKAIITGFVILIKEAIDIVR